MSTAALGRPRGRTSAPTPPPPSGAARAALAALWCDWRPAVIAELYPDTPGRLDLGSYPGEGPAAAACDAVLRHADPADPWPTVWRLRDEGVVAPDAYPRNVAAAGDGFICRLRAGGELVGTARPHRTPDAAWRVAVRKALAVGRRLEEERTRVRVRFPREELPKYLRATRGRAIQARPWIDPGWGSKTNVNLGLCRVDVFGGDREAAIAFARRARSEFLKRMAGPPARDLLDVMEELQGVRWGGLPLIPGHVLPPNVFRLDCGGFGGRVTRNGFIAWEAGPFATVREAWEAVKRYRAQDASSRVRQDRAFFSGVSTSV